MDLWKNQCRGYVSKILSNEQVEYIHECMKDNDECTGRQLHELLLERWPNLSVSIDTIKRERRALGWVASNQNTASGLGIGISRKGLTGVMK